MLFLNLSGAVAFIEENREKIETFVSYLKQKEINHVSLEYMTNLEGVSFIDWDSFNDQKIANEMFLEYEELER